MAGGIIKSSVLIRVHLWFYKQELEKNEQFRAAARNAALVL